MKVNGLLYIGVTPEKPLVMTWAERLSRFGSIINEKIMFLDGILSPAKFGLTGDMNSHFIIFKYQFLSPTRITINL